MNRYINIGLMNFTQLHPGPAYSNNMQLL